MLLVTAMRQVTNEVFRKNYFVISSPVLDRSLRATGGQPMVITSQCRQRETLDRHLSSLNLAVVQLSLGQYNQSEMDSESFY